MRKTLPLLAALLATYSAAPAVGEPAPADDSSRQARNCLSGVTEGRQTSAVPLQDLFRATGNIATIVCKPTATATSQPLAGYYTRWIVEPAALAYLDGQRIYPLEGRSGWKRLFSDRVIETSHILEISMATPDVKLTIPLSSFKYNEEGENGVEYTTHLRNNAFNQPYFRVDANTTINFVAQSQHSFRTSYSGATAVLAAVQDTLKLVVPSSALLTSVNVDQVTSTSNAISSIAKSLFDNSYTETVEDGFGLERWHPEKRVLILVKLPHEITSHRRNKGNKSSDKPVFLSYWLSLACPRSSMFNPGELCAPRPAGTVGPTTSAILAFEIANEKSIQQHLNDKQWYREFLTSEAFGAASKSDRDFLISRFCRNVANEFYNAGFNATDVRLIVRAVIEGMPELSRISTTMETQCGGPQNYGLANFTE